MKTSTNHETGQCDCACGLAEHASSPLSTRDAPTPPTLLSVWLHLTDRCNLHCDYCYVLGLPRPRADMSPATGQAAVDAAFRSALAHGYQRIKFKYAGGESLLRFPLLVDLHRYAKTQAARHGLALDGVVLSNGVLLTSAMVETMLKLDLRLMISLDGIGRYHDCQRHYADGRSSFGAVAAAIQLASECGLVPDISITVSGRNAAGLPEVVAWVMERDLPFSLNFYREHEGADIEWEEESIIAGMLAAYKVIAAHLPRRSLLAALVDRADLSTPHSYPCSAGRSYLVFDTQGRVAKCQMRLGEPVCDATANDPLTLVRADERGLHNPSVDEKPECEGCPWQYACAGGCPVLAHRVTGRYNAKSPHCVIYRALCPEALRLEELRRLQKPGATAIPAPQTVRPTAAGF